MQSPPKIVPSSIDDIEEGVLTYLSRWTPDDYNFFDRGFVSMEILSTLFNTILNRTNHNVISYFFREMEPIGFCSSQSNVMTVKLLGKHKVLLKSPLSDSSRTSSLDEIKIGMKYINQLRQFIPNFPFTFTHFLGGELMTRAGHPIEWNVQTNDDNGTLYSLSEYVHNEGTLRDMIINKLLTEEDLKSIIQQVVISLIIANKMCGFVHGDLNLENILVTKLDGYKSIKYSNDSYVNTRYLATIVDFGNSTVGDMESLTVDLERFLNDVHWLSMKKRKGTIYIDTMLDSLNKGFDFFVEELQEQSERRSHPMLGFQTSIGRDRLSMIHNRAINSTKNMVMNDFINVYLASTFSDTPNSFSVGDIMRTSEEEISELYKKMKIDTGENDIVMFVQTAHFVETRRLISWIMETRRKFIVF